MGGRVDISNDLQYMTPILFLLKDSNTLCKGNNKVLVDLRYFGIIFKNATFTTIILKIEIRQHQRQGTRVGVTYLPCHNTSLAKTKMELKA